MTQRSQWMRRLDELDNRIAAVQQWGALLTAMEEERRAILANLNGEVHGELATGGKE